MIRLAPSAPRFVAALFIPSLLVAACSSSSGEGAGATNIPLDQVAPLVAQAECDYVSRCYGSFANLALQTTDCVARETKSVEAGSFANYAGLVSSGKIAYDGTKVQACLDALRAQDCTNSNNSPDACKQVFTGSTAVGGSCTENEECKDDGVCASQNMTCPGTCTARVPAGNACKRNDDCLESLVCGGDGKCTQAATAGQACNEGSPPCAGTLICFGATTTGKPGTCKAVTDAFTAASGATCDAANEVYCVQGSFCALQGIDQTTSKLTYQCVGPSTTGGACKPSFPESCPTGQYCKADLTKGSVDGTCTDDAADGEACGAGAATCKDGSVCEGQVCRPLQDNGGTCTTGVTCYSGNCTNGVCQAGSACSKP